MNAHLGKWRTDSDLIVCAFAGEKETASALASKILGGATTTGSVFLGTHNKQIDLGKYVEWAFEEDGKLEEVNQHIFTQEHHGGLEMMAQGMDLWNETDNQCINKLQSFCRHRILPLMSSTHRVEGMIRNASLCATSGRSEGLRSAYAVVRSSLERPIGNKTEPKLGKPTKRPARGANRAAALLSHVRTINKKLSGKTPGDEEYQQLRVSFLEEGLNDKKAQLQKKVSRFELAKEKEPNAIQKERGVDVTAASRGDVKFSSLKAARWRGAVQKELHLRGVTQTEEGWNKLRQALKDAVGWTQDSVGPFSFVPLTDELKEFAISSENQ